jgi:protein O-GlcNAc transferase
MSSKDIEEHAEEIHSRGAEAARSNAWPVACRYFRRANRARPEEPRYANSLAIALWRLGRKAEALDAVEKALLRNPDDADLLIHRAKFLYDVGDDLRAIPAIRAAIPLAAVPAALLTRLGVALCRSGHAREGEAVWRKILREQPRSGAVLGNLAGAVSQQGRIEEALGIYERAAAAGAGLVAGSNRLLTMHYVPGSPDALFEAHRAWGQCMELSSQAAPGRRVRRRRLRIGYVSGDFRVHSVARFAEPLLASHDRDRFEIHCFANHPGADLVTARFRRLAQAWWDIRNLGDDEGADLVRKAGIDILVDLSGHTAHHRLGIFARKPAPVQITYLGYPDTTGLTAMDYRFTDSVADPPGVSDRFHTETLIRLDPGFLCFRPWYARLPIATALENRRRVTLGCFAIRQKLSVAVLEAWSRILSSSPGTRLYLKCRSFADKQARADMRAFFRQRGIDDDRLLIEPHQQSLKQHLMSYQRVDLMLDPFPYNGTTATCEALWMGVPVLTRAGDAHVSRVGASILSQMELGELVAVSEESLVGKALDLIESGKLQSLRRGLRGRMQRSPLRDEPGLARRIESACWRAWRS